MALITADRIKQTTTTTGTGPFALSAVATGFRAFSAKCAVGDTFYGSIVADNGDWQSGLFSYSAANQVSTVEVHDSSSAGSAVTFAAGNKEVFIGPTAKLAEPTQSFSYNSGTKTVTAYGSINFERDDGTQPDITATCYGVDGGGILHGRFARGTKASPTGVLSGDIFGGVGSRAYHSGGAFQNSSPTSIHWVASENQTASGYGSYLRILTTPKGSTVRQERVLITDNGTLWCHGSGTFDPKVEAQSKPFPDTLVLASTSGGHSAVSATSHGGTAGFRGGVSGGTVSAPTASVSDSMICFMGGHVYSASGWSAGTKALIGFHAAENATDSAQGTYITLQTTPKGGTTRSERVRVKASGQVRFVPMASAPTVDVEAGDVYYDSTTNKLRCYNGSTWSDLF